MYTGLRCHNSVDSIRSEFIAVQSWIRTDCNKFASDQISWNTTAYHRAVILTLLTPQLFLLMSYMWKWKLSMSRFLIVPDVDDFFWLLSGLLNTCRSPVPTLRILVPFISGMCTSKAICGFGRLQRELHFVVFPYIRRSVTPLHPVQTTNPTEFVYSIGELPRPSWHGVRPDRVQASWPSRSLWP